MKFRILSQYYPPDTATTGVLLSELTAGLRSKGHEIEVITAQPTYNPEISAKSREAADGVTVLRLWSTRIDKNTLAGKVLNSSTFVVSVLLRLFVSSDRTSPLLIVSNPPFLPIVGFILCKLRKVPFVFLVHDVYPDIAIRLGYLDAGGIVQWCWNRLNAMILRASAHIVVLSGAMKVVVATKMTLAGVHDPLARLTVIHNWAHGDFIRPIEKHDNFFLRKYSFAGKFIVQYSGNLGLFHELENVVEAASKVHDQEFVFLFIGEGGKKTKLEKMVTDYGLSNVQFLPFQDSLMLPHSLAAADVAIVSLEEGIDGLAMPSKLYTIMASGTPVVAFCDPNSDIADILNVSQSGFVFRHDDIDGFVAKLKELKGDRLLLQRMKINARLYFEEHFTFEMALVQYEKILLSLKVEER
jgi:glycosyltransferase involved in cell wall biosynthesis